jgi:adenylosuccinate synthase
LLVLGQTWLRSRLLEHKVDLNSERIESFEFNLDKIIERYISDTNVFLNAVTITTDCPENMQIIFEGAQGLMLDEHRKDQFPHVTRSRTGLTNVIELIPQFGIDELCVTYVSRTYLTRHGAGPLKGEEQFSFPDTTNVLNPFQGQLRFARLDPADLSYSIERDLANARTEFSRIQASLAFTCADQTALPAQRCLPLQVSFISTGPTRSDIQEAVFSSATTESF